MAPSASGAGRHSAGPELVVGDGAPPDGAGLDTDPDRRAGCGDRTGNAIPEGINKRNGRFGAGFRMPARHDYSRALPGPASESLPGRNPRVAGWTVAVYGDLTGRRLGLEMRLRA